MNREDSDGDSRQPAAVAATNGDVPVAASGRDFPVVGVGASAGGLEAFSRLLSTLGDRTGMGYVLVQHLDPKHESALVPLLRRSTRMDIREVEDGMIVEPDHVYVIPPDTNLSLEEGGVLRVSPRSDIHGLHLPVDLFLRSLASQRSDRAIGVILSGTGSDGTLGLKAVKAAAGLTFAQDQSAKFDGMPRSAIAAGCVDFMLTPEEIAKQLIRLGTRFASKQSLDGADGQLDAPMDELLLLLKRGSGVDFTHYKRSTLERRIQRRMVVHNLDHLAAYVDFLRTNPAEISALFQDILIHVTSFFRDRECFDTLKTTIFPLIVQNRPWNDPIRIWVPGCSTGEEVYSVAICLSEFLLERRMDTPVKIFATDISEQAIEKARAGRYLANIASDVSEERLHRFFVKEEGGYQINKSIRDLCVFARQDATQDPPFSNLNLISCRNVLIYLGPVLQKRILPIFHYALRNPGFLLLGSAETVGGVSDLFTPIDAKQALYVRKPVPSRMLFDFTGRERLAGIRVEGVDDRGRSSSVWHALDFQREADRVIVSKYAPPGVIIDENLEILQFRGHTGLFLTPAPGLPSLNLLKMAREGLQLDLREAVEEARTSVAPVRRDGLRVRSNGHFLDMNLVVIPITIPTAGHRCYAILFETMSPAPTAGLASAAAMLAAERLAKEGPSSKDAGFARLRDELAGTKEYLHAIIEELEASNEELKAANEEIVSSNEELQSTNEELQTAKEELQAANEELGTVNEELRHRNLDANRSNNDLVNLLTSVNIPIIMLSSDLCIRRFTPSAGKVLNLIPTDLGRPIGDLKARLLLTDLEAMTREVIDTLTLKEREVQDSEGRWYLLAIRPYRTNDHKIDGAVVTLLDVDLLKRSEQIIRENRDFAENIIDTIEESLLVLDGDLKVRTANRSFYRLFQVTQAETEDQLIYELGDGQWDFPRLHTLLETILAEGGQFTRERVEAEFPRIGRRVMQLNARLIVQSEGKKRLLLVAIDDVTDLVKAAREQLDREIRLQAILDTAAEGIVTINEQGIVQSFNKAAEQIFGYPASEIVGQEFGVLMPSPDRENHQAYVKNYVMTGVKKIIGMGREVSGRRRDGTIFPMELAVSEANTDPRIFTGIFRDVTDLKEAQQRALLSERLAAIGQMSAGLAHESRNALQRSQACLEMLAMQVAGQPDLTDLVTRIQDAQDYLVELYEGVKDYAGHIRLNCERCDLNSILNQVWAHLSPQWTGRNVTFHSDPGGLDAWCLADCKRVTQVFRNILENALQACAEPVVIEVNWSEGEPILGRPSLRVGIRNNGPKLTSQQSEKIFEAFFTTKTRGTGLGMAISRRIIESHGGHLTIGDGDDPGVEIVITLPRGDLS
ncbi:MAG: two-component hybrid sensor and regulator [Planctomycetota bacterium]|nr:two-component hybrid sensor and regulator [Planctomycetota bacterium]